jgi:N6-L-threonylcarbamoyladenine synthase
MLKVRELEAEDLLTDTVRADLASAFQTAVVDTLVGKSLRALDETGYGRIIVAGGVGANRVLRSRMAEAVEGRGGRVYYPRTEFCTDNGAMIAFAGLQRLLARSAPDAEDLTVQVRARWDLQEI